MKKVYNWAVINNKTGKLIRKCASRRTARNLARHARNYIVIRRTILVDDWQKPLEVNPNASNDKYAKYF